MTSFLTVTLLVAYLCIGSTRTRELTDLAVFKFSQFMKATEAAVSSYREAASLKSSSAENEQKALENETLAHEDEEKAIQLKEAAAEADTVAAEAEAKESQEILLGEEAEGIADVDTALEVEAEAEEIIALEASAQDFREATETETIDFFFFWVPGVDMVGQVLADFLYGFAAAELVVAGAEEAVVVEEEIAIAEEQAISADAFTEAAVLEEEVVDAQLEADTDILEAEALETEAQDLEVEAMEEQDLAVEEEDLALTASAEGDYQVKESEKFFFEAAECKINAMFVQLWSLFCLICATVRLLWGLVWKLIDGNTVTPEESSSYLGIKRSSWSACFLGAMIGFSIGFITRGFFIPADSSSQSLVLFDIWNSLFVKRLFYTVTLALVGAIFALICKSLKPFVVNIYQTVPQFSIISFFDSLYIYEYYGIAVKWENNGNLIFEITAAFVLLVISIRECYRAKFLVQAGLLAIEEMNYTLWKLLTSNALLESRIWLTVLLSSGGLLILFMIYNLAGVVRKIYQCRSTSDAVTLTPYTYSRIVEAWSLSRCCLHFLMVVSVYSFQIYYWAQTIVALENEIRLSKIFVSSTVAQILKASFKKSIFIVAFVSALLHFCALCGLNQSKKSTFNYQSEFIAIISRFSFFLIAWMRASFVLLIQSLLVLILAFDCADIARYVISYDIELFSSRMLLLYALFAYLIGFYYPDWVFPKMVDSKLSPSFTKEQEGLINYQAAEMDL